jgi:hypothetical protein
VPDNADYRNAFVTEQFRPGINATPQETGPSPCCDVCSALMCLKAAAAGIVAKEKQSFTIQNAVREAILFVTILFCSFGKILLRRLTRSHWGQMSSASKFTLFSSESSAPETPRARLYRFRSQRMRFVCRPGLDAAKKIEIIKRTASMQAKRHLR